MKFSRETYTPDLVAEMKPLWEKHWHEVAFYKDIPLEPDLQIYEASSKTGMMRIFTARQEGVLIGYQVLFVLKHPHYASTLQALQDILFIDPKYRNGMTGYRFIKWCDAQLQGEGVRLVFQHIKGRHDFGRMLERIGYELQDLIYSRRLD